MRNMYKKHFLPEEVDLIKKYYPVIGAKLTAKELEKAGYLRTAKSVQAKAFTLKLKSPLHQKVNSGSFRKGNVSHNKGRRMPVHVYEKAKATMFKPGHKRNVKEVGHISIRKDSGGRRYYKYIKIKDRVWHLLQRHIWEKHHGPIPKGHVITFKDGDSMNCQIDNLEMISMRENARRNVNPEKLSAKWDNPTDAMVIGRLCQFNPSLREKVRNNPELIEIARQQIILNRTIKKNQNDE